MTDNDVIKALECFSDKCEDDCMNCPIEGVRGESDIFKDALDLINRQKAEIKQKDTEIDILIRKKETLKDELAELQRKNSELEIELKGCEANSYKSEVERLQVFPKAGFINLIGNCLVYSKNLKDYNDMRKGLKSEAIKEFAERLKEKAEKTTWISNGEFVVKD